MMKNMLLLMLTLSLFHSELAFSKSQHFCSIETYSHILFVGQKNTVLPKESLIIKSDCNEDIKDAFENELSQLEGKFRASYLSRQLVNQNIKIVPQTITIENLNMSLEEKLGLSSELKITRLDMIGLGKVLKISKDTNFEALCDGCNIPGRHTSKIILTNLDNGKNEIVPLKMTIKSKTRLLKAVSALQSFTSNGLNNYFKISNEYVEDPSLYFTQKKHLKFYKLNKPIQKSEYLKTSDLTPLNIVKLGSLTTVELSTGIIKVSRKAIAKKSGHYGDIVELEVPQTKKRILGKIIDFNKVVVDI